MARLTRLVSAADPGGSTEAIAAVVKAAERDDAQAIAVVGTLGAGVASPRSQRAVFDALAAARRPVFWVPGPDDAPVATYLREAHNTEVVFGDLHGVHGTAALAPGDVVVAGLGGDISDDPDEPHEEIELLRYAARGISSRAAASSVRTSCSRSSDRRRIRETCICEIPTSSAIF